MCSLLVEFVLGFIVCAFWVLRAPTGCMSCLFDMIVFERTIPCRVCYDLLEGLVFPP